MITCMIYLRIGLAISGGCIDLDIPRNASERYVFCCSQDCAAVSRRLSLPDDLGHTVSVKEHGIVEWPSVKVAIFIVGKNNTEFRHARSNVVLEEFIGFRLRCKIEVDSKDPLEYRVGRSGDSGSRSQFGKCVECTRKDASVHCDPSPASLHQPEVVDAPQKPSKIVVVTCNNYNSRFYVIHFNNCFSQMVKISRFENFKQFYADLGFLKERVEIN